VFTSAVSKEKTSAVHTVKFIKLILLSLLSVLWHGWSGHLTRKKLVPDVTYNVFGGMLNLAQSISYCCDCSCPVMLLWWWLQWPCFIQFTLTALLQVYAPTGPVTRDYDDVRRFQEAAEKGLKRLHAIY